MRKAIVVPHIPAEHSELKHSLINLYKAVPERHRLRLMLCLFSFDAWNRFKDLLRACPHHGFTELHQLDTFYNGLNPSDKDSLNSAAGDNLLERSAQDVLKIIENKSKVCNSRNKPIVSQVKASNVDLSEIASAVASVVTSVMTAMFKQHQVTPAPASVKVVEESCVTCGGAQSTTVSLHDGNNFFGLSKTIFKDNVSAAQTARALIDVYGEELTLRVDDEAVTFKVGQTSRYSYNDAVLINLIDVIDVACEEYAQEVLRFSDSSTSGNPTLSLDHILSTSSPSLTPFEEEYFILEEIEACLTNDSLHEEMI
ncbi:hypothetical protein Tco_1420485 [Tanacetum coccineum]